MFLYFLFFSAKESKSELEVVTEKILELLEKAFPDTISVEELAA